MTKERYEYLTSLRGTGELEKNPKLFNELFKFERKAVRIVQVYAIDNTDTIDAARKLIYGMSMEEMLNTAIEHLDIKPSKAALTYLKEFGSII